MKNLKLKSAVLLAITCATSGLAEAKGGGEAGNGGGAHICYHDDAMTFIKSIESYDLYEGRIVHGVPVHGAVLIDAPLNDVKTLTFIALDKNQLLNDAIFRIAKQYPLLAMKITEALSLMNDIDVLRDATDIELEEVLDTKRPLHGKRCRYYQMVNWLDPEQLLPGSKDRVFRDESVYKRMYPYSQAALDLHEAVYKVYRSYADRTALAQYLSRPVRKFVAQAMAGVHIDPILDESSIQEGIFVVPGEKKIVYRSGVGTNCPADQLKIQLKLLRTMGAGDHVSFSNGINSNPSQLTLGVPVTVPFQTRILHGQMKTMELSPLFGAGAPLGAEVEFSVSGCGYPEAKTQTIFNRAEFNVFEDKFELGWETARL